jgi:hypothetical protein
MRRLTPVGLGLFAFLVLAANGCGSGDSGLAGVWTGAFRDNLGGLGGGSFTFSETDTVVQGSWQVIFETFAGRAKFNNSGSFRGTVSGDLVTVQMTSQNSCVFTLQATRSGSHLAGSYDSVGCPVPQKGSVDLERQ